MDCASYPAVLKADGLAAGKGVIIAQSPREAREALRDFFLERRFGEAGARVLVEEFLEGEELSLLALCDGERVVPMAPAQDFKRIGDGDTGPNTGGMGSYSPVPGIDAARAAEIVRRVHQPIVDRFKQRGTPFRGVLYAGPDDDRGRAEGARVQLPLRRPGDPGRAAAPAKRPARRRSRPASRRAGCEGMQLDWSDDWAVTVVLASAGYPASSSKGDVISGLDDARGARARRAHALRHRAPARRRSSPPAVGS